jgi:hypothetical protein
MQEGATMRYVVVVICVFVFDMAGSAQGTVQQQRETSRNAAAFAQPNHGAVLFADTISQNFKSLLGENKNTLFALQSFSPGVEFRTNPRGRVSLGAAYQEMRLLYQQNGSFVDLAVDPATGHYYPVYTDKYVSGKIDAAIGTAYINLLTHRVIQPFVGLGGGIGFGKIDYISPGVGRYRGKSYEVVYKGGIGVNVFPKDRILISASGGYQNGAVGMVQFGFVF